MFQATLFVPILAATLANVLLLYVHLDTRAAAPLRSESFGKGLTLLGCASSAFQNEGWTPESDMKRFVDGELGWSMGNATAAGKASCWWRPDVFRHDVDLIAGVDGLNAFRMSVSWSRVQPNGAHHVDHAALRQYQSMVKYVRSRGLEPVGHCLIARNANLGSHSSQPTYVT